MDPGLFPRTLKSILKYRVHFDQCKYKSSGQAAIKAIHTWTLKWTADYKKTFAHSTYVPILSSDLHSRSRKANESIARDIFVQKYSGDLAYKCTTLRIFALRT